MVQNACASRDCRDAGWHPLLSARLASTIGCVIQLGIRCQPCLPLSEAELEHWLERQVHELRAAAPHGTVRLSRLMQGAPSADVKIGWLVELELRDGERLVAGQRLADALRDMRLLGLQPTLLAPRAAWSNGAAT